MFTDVFSADDIAAPARRTGFVQRASKSTGQRLLALVTFGSWRDATTTLAPWAAKVTQGGAQLAVSPDASHQRLNHGAGAVLQDMLRQALAKVPALDTVCAEGLLTCCTKGSLADSPGVALPDRVHDLFPGAGGRASTAGATMHAVWEYKSRVCGHFALTPWHMPDQQYLDNVGAFVPQGVWCLGDWGDLKIKAVARIAEAGADFFRRLHHQTHLVDADTARLQPLALAALLSTVERNRTEKALCLGAKEPGACRLVASRLPEPIVQERRRIATKKAQQKGDTPSNAHRSRLAWNLLLTKVPCTIGQPATIGQVSPLRWPIERIFKSWKSSRPVASIKTKTAAPTWGSLYGRMLLIWLNEALGPQIRHTLWAKQTRERSLRTLVRHVQALADRWMRALLQADGELRRFLARACATAERWVAKASRQRRTTAQILHESLSQEHEVVACVAAVTA